MTLTVHGIDIVVGNERRAAIDIALEFVREQSEGEWTDEQIKTDAARIADLMMAFAEKSPPPDISGWLTEQMELSGKDADAHPEGHSNRAFYRGKEVAYENALSALKRAGQP